MPRDVERVEIQGPPIDEIQKRSSCLKRSCVTLLVAGSIFLFLITGFIHLVVRPDTKELDTLPASIPPQIPIYDKDNVDLITYTAGKERAQAIELLAYVPKAILSPLILAIENTDLGKSQDTTRLWDSFLRILGTPVEDHRDVLTITWSRLQASPTFITAYYRTHLGTAGYTEMPQQGSTKTRFVDTHGTSVVLELRDNGNENDGTDYGILKIYLP